MRFISCVCLLVSAHALALPALDQARAELKALRYPAAEKALKAVSSTDGLTREQVLEYYELKGLVAAGANRPADARDAFAALLSLSPEFRLKGKQGPRFTTPFSEALALVREHGPLAVSVAATPSPTKVGAVSVTLTGSTQLVRGLLVELDEEGATRTLPLPAGGGSVDVLKRAVTVTVRVLGDRDWSLLVATPQRFVSPEAPAPKPVVVEAAPVVVAPVAQPEPRFRPLAYTLAGVGAAVVGAGVGFGVLANTERGRLNQVDLTRAEALELAPRAVRDATIANALFIAGGALLAGGVVTFLLGLPPSSTVALVPTGDGVVAAGGFSW